MKLRAIIYLVFTFFVFTKTVNSQNHRALDSLIRLSKSLNDTARANVYDEICVTAFNVDPKISVEYANKLIHVANTGSTQKYAVRGYEVIGIYYFINTNLDSSLFYFEKAKDIAHKNKLLQKEARLYFRMSFVYVAKNNSEKSIKSILKAIEIEQSLPSKTFLSEYKNKLGGIFLEKRDYANALKYCNEALNDDKYTDAKAIGYIYQNLGFIAKELRDYSKSLQYFRESNFYLIKRMEFRAVAGNYNMLYLNFTALNQFDSANYYNNLYYKYAKITSTPSNIFAARLNSSVLNLMYFKNYKLSKLYLDSTSFDTLTMQMPEYRLGFLEQTFLYEIATGDLMNGYKHYNLFINLKDSLFSNENLSIAQKLNVQYETEKRELQIKNQSFEIETQEKQNKQKSLIILFGTLALLGTGFFAAMAFINFKKAKKANLIIENQKMEVELKNEEITHQRDLVEEKQKEIIDSINYAKRIQQAVLTGEDVWQKVSKEHFILFKPKDIVSGDFYWAYNTPNNRSVFALADCTGHGVPGGFMSMLGNSFLNEIVVENKIFKADEILNKLRAKIINALEQKGGTQQKDGMDISLCVWNKIDNTLEFAGANNPLWLLRGKELLEYKADKMPIGTYLEAEVPFSSTVIPLQQGDIVFLSTDGYADQFGGPKGKKYKYKPLIESLIKHSNLSMEEQKIALETAFNNWKHQHEQVDDVSLIGIKVG
jgi:serine phosphatase RsbU (regulator of sigma subunit)